MSEQCEISVVIPLLDEAESINELSEWIVRVMDENSFSYEIIYVDDGSKDNSWQIIEDLHRNNPRIKGIKFNRNYGKSPGLHVGFARAVGKVVFTMDADLQDSPDEIPEMYRMVVNDGFDLVSGWKKKRYDPLSKTIPTKLFNWATCKASGLKLHDFNCGLKAYNSRVIKGIEIYGEMHRYIPMIAKWAGFDNIGEKVVRHQKRKYGASKFGLDRFINGFLDLILITFISRFGKKPMHFFGPLGVLMFIVGGFITLWLIFLKIYQISSQEHVRDIVDQPLFYLALVAMIIGTQFFMTGFLGELIVRNSGRRNKYLIEKEI
ncbi:MAG TPA: glycosyltransferase [Flavobacteriales bacterium]|nr:glycosyltransferase [Flavobacteriales bacterium]